MFNPQAVVPIYIIIFYIIFYLILTILFSKLPLESNHLELKEINNEQCAMFETMKTYVLSRKKLSIEHANEPADDDATSGR